VENNERKFKMFHVDKEKCTGCEACISVCPADAISMVDGKAMIDANQCIDCGQCAPVCPQGAIYPAAKLQQWFPSNQGQMPPNPNFGMGRGLGRGMGKGLGRGPRDGRGRGKGGGGRRR
jgi:Fe-S-cluster-containing hydrogenase component 2